MTNFLSESNQCNFNKLKYVGPYRSNHAEPTAEEIAYGEKVAHEIMEFLLQHTYNLCGKVFNYRVDTSESLIQNLYEFFYTLLYTKFKFCYSPNYGFTLWPGTLGFIRIDGVSSLVKDKLHILFEDYITETTTFVRYHYECRFNTIFQSYKIPFLKAVMHSLIQFGASIGRQQLITDCIKSALNMIYTSKKLN